MQRAREGLEVGAVIAAAAVFRLAGLPPGVDCRSVAFLLCSLCLLPPCLQAIVALSKRSSIFQVQTAFSLATRMVPDIEGKVSRHSRRSCKVRSQQPCAT